MQGKAAKRLTGINGVLFDMDGVLVDSRTAWFYVINDTLAHYGYKKFNFNEFKKAFGSPIEKDAKTIYHGKPVQEIIRIYNKRFKIRINKVKIFDDTISTLRILKKRKIKLGLITNSTKYITNLFLNHFKIKKYFDIIITAEDVKKGKPAPDLIYEACRRLKINSRDVILVGDSKNDILAGKRAKCITVGFKIKGDYEIKSLYRLLEMD